MGEVFRQVVEDVFHKFSQRRIDTAELDRVFGPLTLRNGSNGAQGSKKDGAGLFGTSGGAPTSFGDGASGASSAHAGQSNTAHAGEHAALERLLADREASIADLRGASTPARPSIFDVEAGFARAGHAKDSSGLLYIYSRPVCKPLHLASLQDPAMMFVIDGRILPSIFCETT